MRRRHFLAGSLAMLAGAAGYQVIPRPRRRPTKFAATLDDLQSRTLTLTRGVVTDEMRYGDVLIRAVHSREDGMRVEWMKIGSGAGWQQLQAAPPGTPQVMVKIDRTGRVT